MPVDEESAFCLEVFENQQLRGLLGWLTSLQSSANLAHPLNRYLCLRFRDLL
jgi:hypothetical protein